MALSRCSGGKFIKLLYLITFFLALMSKVEKVCGTLPGSCIAAGYTGCCKSSESNGQCSGVPSGQCFCDPICMNLGDCCEDLHEICNGPEVDAAILSLVPVMYLIDSLSFHTASFHWTTSIREAEFLLINGSYYEFTLLDSISSSVITTYSTPVVNSLANDRTSFLNNFHMLNLEKNTSYIYRLTAISNYETNETVANGTFTTLEYTSIENVNLQVFDTSVRVSWFPPPLPPGVTIVQYNIHYSEHWPEEQGGERMMMIQSISPDEIEGMIHNLHPNQLYYFSISVEVLEINGVIYDCSSAVSLQDSVEVFVPGSSYFQLVTSAELSCDDWTILDEKDVTEIFLSSVLKLIQASCNCQYSRQHVREQSILCINNGTTSQLTYRAQLLSIIGHSSDKLVGYVESWRREGPSIGKWKSESNLTIDDSQNCRAKIDFKSAPLCVMRYPLQKVPDGKTDVSLTIFVAALIAETIFLLTIMLVIVAIMARALSKSKTRIERSTRDRIMVETNNSYGLPASNKTRPISFLPKEKLETNLTLHQSSHNDHDLYNDKFLL